MEFSAWQILPIERAYKIGSKTGKTGKNFPYHWNAGSLVSGRLRISGFCYSDPHRKRLFKVRNKADVVASNFVLYKTV